MLVLSCGWVSVCTRARCHCSFSNLLPSVFSVSAYRLLLSACIFSHTWLKRVVCTAESMRGLLIRILSSKKKAFAASSLFWQSTCSAEIKNPGRHLKTFISEVWYLYAVVCNLVALAGRSLSKLQEICMSHLYPHNWHPGQHQHLLIWRRL